MSSAGRRWRRSGKTGRARRPHMNNVETYVFGTGPLDELWSRVMAGELSVRQAEQIAPSLRDDPRVTPNVLEALSDFAKSQAIQGYLQAGLTLCLILDGALEGVTGASNLARARAVVRCDLLEIARAALTDAPDPGLFERARRGGEWARSWGCEHGNGDVVSAALFRLGTLHLDPYTDGRDSRNYWTQHHQWLRRGLAVADEIVSVLQEVEAVTEYGIQLRDPDIAMPEPVEALRVAERYLRQATEVREGPSRGYAVKALIQALVWRSLLGDPVKRDEVEALIATALKLLPLSDVAARSYVISAQRLVGTPTLDHSLVEPLERNLEGYAAAEGGKAAMYALHTIVSLLESSDPERALRLLRGGYWLVQQKGSEWDRATHYGLEALLMPRVYAGVWQPLIDVTAGVEQIALDDAHTPTERAAALLDLARRAIEHDDLASVGLNALATARRLDPDLVGACPRAYLYIRANLSQGSARDHASHGRESRVAGIPATAVRDYLAVDLFRNALDSLDFLGDHVADADTSTYSEVAAVLYEAGPRLALYDRDASRLVQVACERSLGALLTSGAGDGKVPLPVQPVLSVQQAAKGLLLAGALAFDPPALPELDDMGSLLLAQIAAMEQRVPHSVIADVLDEDDLLEDDLLVGWTDTAERRPADTQEERLRNRQRVFDRHLSQLLLPARNEFPTALDLNDVQAVLDARTVLLICAPAELREQEALTCLLVTHDDVAVGVTRSNMPRGDVQLTRGDHSSMTSTVGLFVSHLRQDLQLDPGPALVHPDAAKVLAKADLYLGAFTKRLTELRSAGKDRLWIVPHGPMHYFPFHLLGPEGTPLAEAWTVTYLPNIGLLRRRSQINPSMRRTPIASFGLTYRDQRRPPLPMLDGADSEAEAVAATFGASAVPEQDSTRTALITALRESRRVHLAAHGRHNVDAPAFQAVLLAGTGEEGRLYSHELVGLDLRGLELVTLSACETALGRFDRNDNLSGLPAALFLAGVETIIGTLWPVENSAAATFFPALYRQLATGAAIFDAFREAQAVTRADFPQYRDWGSFCLMGGVRRCSK